MKRSLLVLLVVTRGNKRLKVRLLSNVGTPHGVLAVASSRASLLLLEKESDPASEPHTPSGQSPNAAAPEEFGLSPREREVLTWVAQGKTNREIAVILDSKLGTVRKHIEHIFQKLGVETRTAAAAMALRAAKPEG